MSTGKTLEARLHRLEAIEAIHALKARYAELADAKYTWDWQRQPDDTLSDIAWQQARCFTAEAVWYGGEFGGDLRGHEQLHSWFRHSPWRYARHLYASPVIEVEEDRASARWQLWQTALREDNAQAVFLFATTHETYRRLADGRWLIDSMAFEDVHLLPATSLPSPFVHRLSELGCPGKTITESTL